MALLIGYPLSDSTFGQPFSNYYFWATMGTLAIIVVYVMLCVGGIAFFAKTRDTRRWNPLVHVVVPLIGASCSARRCTARCTRPRQASSSGPPTWADLARLGVGVVLWLRAQRPGCGGADRLHPRRGGRTGRGPAGQATLRKPERHSERPP